MSLLDRNTTYDPSKEYFFVDYHDIEDCRWVRSPYNTIEEVTRMISDLPYVYDKEKNEVLPMFRRLRVTPHTELAKLYQVWNEEEKKWENDTITKGCVMFDLRYDCPEIYGLPESLTKDSKESQEDWEARVAVRQEEIEKGWKDDFAEDRRRKELWNGFPTPGVAYLLGKSMRKKIADQVLRQENGIEESDED